MSPKQNKEYFIIDLDSDSEEEQEKNFIWPSLPACWKDKKFFCIHPTCGSCDCTKDETASDKFEDKEESDSETDTNSEEEGGVKQSHFSFGTHTCKNSEHFGLLQFENYTSPRPTWPHSCYCSFDDTLKNKLLQLCDILNLQCTCTDSETCTLCAFINLGYGENSQLIISDYERIALARLELLFPFLDLNKKTEKNH